jgi:N-acetylmuramoyl-L-alanine amidase
MLFFAKKKYSLLFLFLFLTPAIFLCAERPASKGHMRSSRPLVVLDAGHGGFNVGARGHKPYCEEKKLALATAQMVKQYLEDLGYRVVMTRSCDFFVPLERRVFIANHSRAEIFVSIHFNSCPSKEVHGIEVYYTDCAENKRRSSESKKLASAILNKTVNRSGALSRGVRSAHFVVIRETNIPAILVEGGYITNLTERKLLRSREHLEKIAHGIAEGVQHYFRSS